MRSEDCNFHRNDTFDLVEELITFQKLYNLTDCIKSLSTSYYM